MRKVFLLLLFSSFIIRAAYGLGIRTGDNITISKPIYEDVYIAGGTIIIDAPVYGDLVIAGGTVTVNGMVENDITIAGGEVTINGTAGDDVRGVGGEININGIVTGDLVTGGGSITIADTSVIHGSALIGSGTAVIGGDIQGSLTFAGRDITLNGIVEKNVYCRGNNITINGTIKGESKIAAGNIDINSNAAFYNNVQYRNNDRHVDFKQTMKKGDAIYNPSLEMSTNKWQYLGFGTLLGVLWYIAVVYLFILLIQYLFSNTMKNAADEIFNNTLRSLGLGVLFLLGVPVAVVILLISIIGLPAGIIVLIAYITLLLLATIISSVVAANWLNRRGNKKWNTWRLSLIAMFVFIVMKLLFLTPVLGWFVMPVIVSMVYGSILSVINWKRGPGPITVA